MHSHSNRWWLLCQLERFARGRPRRWHPNPADTLCPAQLCSPLQCHSLFSQIRSQKSQTLALLWKAQDVKMFEGSQALKGPLTLTVRLRISPDAIAGIEWH